MAGDRDLGLEVLMGVVWILQVGSVKSSGRHGKRKGFRIWGFMGMAWKVLELLRLMFGRWHDFLL